MGDKEKVHIYFLGVHNSCRSQMAEAFAKLYAGEQIVADSAGIEIHPIHPLTIEALREVGIDISNSHSKQVTMKAVTESNLVVRMCHQTTEKCPIVPFGTKNIQWDILDPIPADPQSARIEDVRAVRDDIRLKVLELLQSLNVQIRE